MTEPVPVPPSAPAARPASRPATSPAHAPAGRGSSVFVALTDDATLREAVEGAVAKRGRAVITNTPQNFADQLMVHAGAIAILDLTRVAGGGAQFVERLRAQFPGLVLVAAGGARDQTLLAPLVADGTVCRFAHKPVSAQRLGLFLDAALRRREALRLEQREILLAPMRPATSSAARIALSILLLLAAAGTALWLLRRPALPGSAASRAALPPTATARQVAAAAATRSPAADTPPAATGSAPAAAAAPPPPADDTPSDDPLAQARQEVQLARRLMDAGLLIDPPNNSARSHIAAAMRLAPEDAEVRRGARALSGRLVAATRSALLAEDLSGAQHWLDAARAYGVNAATLADLEQQLDMLKAMLQR
jgi:DNA-binding NarL/FixJ family response regulator